MTALEATFTGLALLAFGATAWISALVAWRILKAPKR
jgi:hypothetical protein